MRLEYRTETLAEFRMIYLLTTIHVIVCLFLVVVVLLQSGKAADLAGAFGGMGSQTVFGPQRVGDGAFEGDHHRRGAVHGDVVNAVDHGDAERRIGAGDFR